MSSVVAPKSIATAASAISSDAFGPTMCTPSTASVAASAMMRTPPSVSPVQRARRRREREAADAHLVPGGFCGFPAHPDACEFRPGVDHGRDRVVVHVTGHARHALHARDAFLGRLVREHRAGDDVADREDAGHARLAVGADPDAAALTAARARLGQSETFVERAAAERTKSSSGLIERSPRAHPSL